MEQQSQSFKYAGFWVRFFALLIDGLLMVILITVISLIFHINYPVIQPMSKYFSYWLAQIQITYSPDMVSDNLPKKQNSVYWLLILLVEWSYFVVMTKVYGGTVGKLLLGIRVVDLNYNKISWGRAILREILGRILSGIIFGLGYLWVAWDSKKQGWHDKIASTYVIKV